MCYETYQTYQQKRKISFDIGQSIYTTFIILVKPSYLYDVSHVYDKYNCLRIHIVIHFSVQREISRPERKASVKFPLDLLKEPLDWNLSAFSHSLWRSNHTPLKR